MQSEDIAHARAHAHHSDDTAIPPSSPLSTGFHRHHPQPTPTAEAADPLSGLRRRGVPGPTQDDPAHVSGQGVGVGVVRIDVRNPWSDGEGRRKEGWVVQRDKTVGELKEELARGEYEGRWEREGMRIVWQGRIVRDEEMLGDVVGIAREPQYIHTFHLVARRIPPNRSRAPSPYRSLSSTAIPPPQPIAPDPEPSVSSAPGPSTSSTLLAQSAVPELSPTTLALLDTTHYLLFTARHHLAHLLALPPLRWEDTVPPPVVSQAMAKEAVSSVVRTFAQDQESDLEGWEGAFEGDDSEELAAVWDKSGERGGVEAEIKGLWQSRIGRQWSSGDEGESVVVEVDDVVYQLHLPPLGFMSATQLLHLVLYLRITSLLPHLSLLLERASQPAPPTPTPTLRPTPTINPVPPPTIWSRVRSFRVPVPVLTHMFFSGLKILAMLWMLTQHMAWDDFRLWILGGAAGGWWLGDGMHRLHRERQVRGGAAAQPGIPRPDGQGGVDDGIPPNVAADAPIHAAAAAAAAVGGAPVRPRIPRQRARNPWTLLSLLHMDVDARQLHLPLSSTHSALDASDAQRTATDPARAEAIRRRAGRQPARLLTQLLLPVALWVITLVPEFEAIRARAIRRRERAMRVLVGELTANSPETGVGGVGGDESPAERIEAGAAEGEGEGEGVEQLPVPRHVFPQGLGLAAGKYYVRVMQRGEGIDWEEEREAQRALGVGDEDADEGDGMRLRML